MKNYLTAIFLAAICSLTLNSFISMQESEIAGCSISISERENKQMYAATCKFNASDASRIEEMVKEQYPNFNGTFLYFEDGGETTEIRLQKSRKLMMDLRAENVKRNKNYDQMKKIIANIESICE